MGAPRRTHGTGAVLTAIAAIVFMASKFGEGAWLLLIIIPALLTLFRRIERYYDDAGHQLGLDVRPDPPTRHDTQPSMVIVPVVDVSRLSELALTVAYRIGGEVVPVAVSLEPESTRQLCARWETWDPALSCGYYPARTAASSHPSSATCRHTWRPAAT